MSKDFRGANTEYLAKYLACAEPQHCAGLSVAAETLVRRCIVPIYMYTMVLFDGE